MASPYDLPDRQLDPPEPAPWCRRCGFDPSCDCEPEEPEDCPATMRDGELYECDMYLEPYQIDGEDAPLPEDE